ncbi:sec-independent protein translocase protein TatB [Granulicella rosea]|uniref:Sec-independent protein translocase protein TatB n=1 Tax=Granulicella rosea TaxID=474952 RepID=A0A239E4F5_9BACT|nr:twin-arginine translocase TatA/TatE family subunit [Granulicella rosea]SNS39281.1 sec-independent protein translocase protein TatB [Granulicella rosea]
MPSFQDSAVIFVIALLLFGPKKLPELARQIGKLMAEFRRASNEFRMQMDEELRLSEQAERQKQIAAMEAAAPIAPALDIPEPEHPHMPTQSLDTVADSEAPLSSETVAEAELENRIHAAAPEPAPLPIATSGDLNLMPPATGLPVGRSGSSTSLSPVFDAIPPAHEAHEQDQNAEAHLHG